MPHDNVIVPALVREFVAEMQEQGGHSSIETTMLYVVPDLTRRKAVVQAMQNRLRELCGTNAGGEVIQ